MGSERAMGRIECEFEFELECELECEFECESGELVIQCEFE